VFGWGRQVWPLSDGGSYHLFLSGDMPAGGMIQITPEMKLTRTVWLGYFAVESCDSKVERALSLGGTVAVAAADVPDVGRFACLVDPAGAHFGVLQSVRRAA